MSRCPARQSVREFACRFWRDHHVINLFRAHADIDQREVISRWVGYLEMVADTGKFQQGRRVFRRLRQIRRTHEQFDARQNRQLQNVFPSI